MQNFDDRKDVRRRSDQVASSSEDLRVAEEGRIADFRSDLQHVVSSQEYHLACELLRHPTLGKLIKDEINSARSPAIGIHIGSYLDTPSGTKQLGAFLDAIGTRLNPGLENTSFKAHDDRFRVELDGEGLRVLRVIAGPLPGTDVGHLEPNSAKKLARTGTTIADIVAKVQLVCHTGLPLAKERGIVLETE